MAEVVGQQDVAKLLGVLFPSVSDLRLLAKKLSGLNWGEQVEPSINFERAPAVVRAEFAEQLAAHGGLNDEHIGDLIALLLKERPGQRARIVEVLGSAPPAPAAPAQPPRAAAGADRNVATEVGGRRSKPNARGAAVGAAAPNHAPADRADDLQSEAPAVEYDIFFAHASPDKALAGKVVQRLRAAGLRVFFDADLRDGDWDRVIPGAVRRSSMVACLCSGVYGAAHYFRDEVQLAVKLHRQDAARWRLRPIGVRGFPGPQMDWPYGLGVMNAIICGKGQGAAWIADELLADFRMTAANGRRPANATTGALDLSAVGSTVIGVERDGVAARPNGDTERTPRKRRGPSPAAAAPPPAPLPDPAQVRAAARTAALTVLCAQKELTKALAERLGSTAAGGPEAVVDAWLVKPEVDALGVLSGALEQLGAAAPGVADIGALVAARLGWAAADHPEAAALRAAAGAGGAPINWTGKALTLGLVNAASLGVLAPVGLSGAGRSGEATTAYTLLYDHNLDAPFLQVEVTERDALMTGLADDLGIAPTPGLVHRGGSDLAEFVKDAVGAHIARLDELAAELATHLGREREKRPKQFALRMVVIPRSSVSDGVAADTFARVKGLLGKLLGASAPPVYLLGPTSHADRQRAADARALLLPSKRS